MQAGAVKHEHAEFIDMTRRAFDEELYSSISPESRQRVIISTAEKHGKRNYRRRLTYCLRADFEFPWRRGFYR